MKQFEIDNLEPEVLSVNQILEKDLNIPDYQRPYKWTRKNVLDLFSDIKFAIAEYEKFTEKDKSDNKYRYRLGTIIIHINTEKNTNDIVDGQQRLITLSLIKHALSKEFSWTLLQQPRFNDTISKENIYNNYQCIIQQLNDDDELKNKLEESFDKILQVILLKVINVSEAFQLFDSQNNRGKALAPHDLLKAYHLREIQSDAKKYEVVKKWENVESKNIEKLFYWYLFPIYNWSKKEKSARFTAQEIDVYKGVKFSNEDNNYPYIRRTMQSMLCFQPQEPFISYRNFQINEPFVAGECFFNMVEHYLNLLAGIENTFEPNAKKKDKVTPPPNICELTPTIKTMQRIIKDTCDTSQFWYCKNLFYCSLLFYYDRFGNLDNARVIKNLFIWSMSIRLNFKSLKYETINNYAVNDIPMFFKIANARKPEEIADIQLDKLNILEYFHDKQKSTSFIEKTNKLYEELVNLMGGNKNE